MNRGLRLDRLAKDTVLNLLRQGFSAVVSMAISVLLARGLGVNDKGLYTLATLLPKLVVTFTNFGLAPATAYFVALGKYSKQEAVRSNWALSFWIGIISLLVGSFIGFFFREALFKGVPLILLFIALMTAPAILLQRSLQAVSQGMQDFKSYNAFLIAPQLLMLAMLLVLVWKMALGTIGALWAYVASTWVSTLILVFFIISRVLRSNEAMGLGLSLRFNRKYSFDVLSYGFRSHIGNIVAYLNYDIDMFLINALTNASAVGIYGLAVGMGEKLWILSGAVSTVLFPRIASLEKAADKQSLLTPLVTRHVFLFTLLTAIPLGLLSNWVILLLYGQEFLESAAALRWLLPGIIMLATSRILANDIAGRGKPQVNLWQSLMALALNILANYILIPKFGAAGASMSSSLSYTFLAIIKTMAYTRISGVPWYVVWFPISDDFKGWKTLFNMLVLKVKGAIQQVP